jgi:hypothetical protein
MTLILAVYFVDVVCGSLIAVGGRSGRAQWAGASSSRRLSDITADWDERSPRRGLSRPPAA